MCRWETIYGEFANKSYLGDLNEKTGYKYKKSLPYIQSTGEGFTEKFILRTTTLQENQDIIVDWGDGTFSNVKNGDFESVSSSGFDYTMSHTYTQPTEFDKEILDLSNTTIKYRKTKRYIIKIYGKQYYGFRYTNIEPYNLMCRCLDWDLPVASHFTNLASFCYGAKGLQVVAVPEYTTYLKNAINFSSMFDGPVPNNCVNLISVTGFGKNDNDINYACNYMFNDCHNLSVCDFILPNLNTGSMANIFNNCSSLIVDINSLIPKQGFLHKEINVEKLFNSTAISGTVPANLLWNDNNITWKNTSNTFSNCSDEIRAQVPVSWGGTNKLIDAEITLNKLNVDKIDYTAFEVYPTDHDIPRGSSELGEVIWNDSTITTNFNVVASMTEEFSLWITKSRLESDIVIDWGDGTIEKLSELTPTSGTANDGQVDVLVYVAHTYEIPNKRYIVKVYGNDYCRLSHNITKLNSANRLLCRCFTDDLPVSHHLNNLGSFAYRSNRLVKVDIPSYSELFTHVVNWSSTFNACYNLRYCYGFGNMFQSVYSIDNILNGCGGLLDTDIKMRSMLFSGTSSSFNGCTNLERNVLDFFGSQLNVGTSPFNVQRLFTNCAKIHLGVTNADYEAELEKFNNGEENTLTVMKATMNANAIKLGNLLWNNKNIVWNWLASDGKTGPFSGCSAVLKSYVPISWGGTASDTIIDDKLSYDDIEIDTLLSNKADLVSGKVPESQLPDLLKLGETSTTAYSGSAGKQLAAYVMNNLKVSIEDINDDLSNTPQLVSRINSRKIYTKQIYYYKYTYHSDFW